MQTRKKCLTCGKPLIAFMGNFLHVEEPCNGVLDYLYIEAQVEDKFLHKRFTDLYGFPDIDDDEALTLLEEENSKQKKVIQSLRLQLNKPLVKFVIKLISKFQKRH